MALSPARPGRSMAIDSLLNPPDADRADSKHYGPGSGPGPGPLTPQYSPLYPPSPKQFYYPEGQYQSHHRHYSPYQHSQSHGYPQPQPHSQAHPQDPFMSYRPSHSQSFSAASSPELYPRDRHSSVSSSSTNGHSSHRTSHHSHSSHGSSLSGDRRRPPRPKYEEEEMYFIWYHRVDLCQEWKEVRESFNRQFPARQRRGFQGIQCKFYRFIKEKKCPTLREQRRMRDGEFLRQEAGSENGGESASAPIPSPSSGGFGGGGAPQFGVVEWMGVWYPWMREDRGEVMRKRLVR